MFSAPGESPPPLLRNTHGTASDIHRDVVNTRIVVNNIHNMLKSQEEAGYQPQLVSVIRILSLTEYTLTIAQTQKRSVISIAERSSVLHLYLVSLENYHLRHQGSSLDATN